jgi:hypothetical protein
MRRDSRSSKSTIGMRIIPDKRATEQEKKKFKQFFSHISDFAQLPSVIEEVEQIMGLGKAGEPGTTAFSRHVLSIEIVGPDRPSL